MTFNDHGTTSVQGKSSVTIEADDYYFSPTFLRGVPGQTVQVQLTNDSGTKHNFTVSQQTVDADLDPKGKAQVTVTIPSSGVLQFFCEYHTGRGMNGELLAGSTAPQAPPAASPKPASSSRSTDYGY